MRAWKDGVGTSSSLSILLKATCLEGQCRGVVRLRVLPKTAYLEGRCREVVQLKILPKAVCLEGQCRDRPFRV